MIGLLLLLFALGIMAVRLALKARISSLTWYIDDGWDRKITKKNLNNFVLVKAISNSLVGWLVADAVIDVMHNFANDKSLQDASNAFKLSVCFLFSNIFS